MDQSWKGRRIIQNEDQVTNFLQEQCRTMEIEMEVANFYGDEGSQTSYQEQAHFVSRSNIMIGVHGAGLNLAMFMPFDSVVIEIHLNTGVQKNSQNTIAQLGGGKYFALYGRKDSAGNLDKVKVWNSLKKAIEWWEAIQRQHIR